MQAILSSLETVAAEYGISLNKIKTELLVPAESTYKGNYQVPRHYGVLDQTF